ncbi:MAG TPA: FAD-dependent oxidoreductase [Bacteroidales bacterium]|jgi:NADPH-dependent 2,4-dienoyl-CoA reductase/sulfur reductase-like enzyme/peroxiredoxin family protein/TusA-related sulfurtransferase/rhodanese-related sulfurtransferase|nr:FAD-dependent oxidoreductase [Bacteroidales bacterium]MCZ2417540.1 FAD-dependent oxidoreductase [Burkholderiales bacterium]OQC58675.1 MAG: Coenzyme A disulfide reductase [Bacteroidetes bacterium ADurb.Bin013]MBP8999024.1 FAD-dependent oxidoreductase [Bacteroidales bacterium]MBV6455735.1 Coenzyme A disulfide reductase [Bacteroidales bacterium]
MKHVIIGGVAGGATTAARIRRNDENAEIIMFEKGKYISYANCGLPYYIGDVIKDRAKLFVQTPESFGKRFNVDVRVNSEVIGIDTEKQLVTVRNAKGDEYRESYDKLLLSPGANPVKPPLPGIDSEGIFTLRNVDDTDRIKEYMRSHPIRRAVVVGAGFIGLEMAENLHATGAHVAIVEMAEQVMTPIDFSMAGLVHQHLYQKHVDLHLNQAVQGFIPVSGPDPSIKINLKNGNELEADIVILSIGVRPDTTLAKQAGITLGRTGGIQVNEYLRTSAENVYAIGDAIEFPHPVSGEPWLNYLAGPANRQARIVADNMVSGDRIKYEGSIGTSIARVFDLTVASTGLPGKKLKQLNIPYLTSTTHSNSHAGYYPNALQMSTKITFDPETGRLYGGQIVGYDGVDKRIDLLAHVVKKQGSIYDLITMEHAYAPPFSSAKDPVAIAGYVASNILSGKMKPVYWRKMQKTGPGEVTKLDVRTAAENSLGTISGSVNIPVDELRNRLDEVPRDKPVYVFCAVGLRGYLASNILIQNGFNNVYNLSGGYKTYEAAAESEKKSIPITPAFSAPYSDSGDPLAKNKAAASSKAATIEVNTLKIDATGLQCPGPIMKIKSSIDSIVPGQRVEIQATDPGFARDIQAWCQTTGNVLVQQSDSKGVFTAVVEKKERGIQAPAAPEGGKGKTLIMFSDDLDKALATFVLANGAAATGEKVSIFFTFWGLNVIKKIKKPAVKKDIFGKMFGMMLPSHSGALKLSKMNMFGMGRIMMRHIMKIRGIDSLEDLRRQAIENGVEFIACQMSMDVMGVKAEELMDNVIIGGVATYMNRAVQSNVNLFI